MRIDPTNYEVAVDRASAALTQRQIEFDGAEQLRSQGYRAEAEYASAAAALAAAEADLVNAERNLERTRISLPYAGMVRSKDADLGQYVNPGTRLGVTFATDYAEVRLPLTDSDLGFVDLPEAADVSETGDGNGPPVTLTAVQKGNIQTWQAQIVRTEGVVDESSRMTYAVARVRDPYMLNGANANGSALPVGTFVAADITGMTLSEVVRVPRSALRSNNQLLTVDDENRLQIRDVSIIRADATYAYVESGVRAGDRIVLTTIASPVNGMTVRIGATEQEPQGAQSLAGADRN